MGEERIAQPVAFQSFRGLNTKLSQVSISPREASSMKNYHLTQETLQVRNGNALFTTTQLVESGAAKAVNGLIQGVIGSTVHRLVTGGTKVYSCTSGGVLADITGAFTISDSANNLMSMVVFKDSGANDVFVGGNGVNANWKWNGSGNIATLGGSPPANLKNLVVHKNRLWGSNGEFIYHSALLNGESWDAVNWVIRLATPGISTNEVTGITPYGDNLVFAKEKGIWMFSGENAVDGYLQQVVTKEGTLSHFSLVEISSRRFGNIICFVNRNLEIKGFNGTKDLIPISDPIDGTLNSYNTSRSKYVSGVEWNKKKEYLITLSKAGSSSHNHLIGYDYYLDGFDMDPEGKNPRESTMLPFEGISGNIISLFDISNEEIVMIGTYDGWVLKNDSGTKDVEKASQIDGSGAVRTSNVVTITTLAPHGFALGDEVIISGVTDSSFNGTFTVASAPTTTTFTYAQTDGNASSGSGSARKETEIETLWESGKNSHGNAAYLKQLNDFNIVTVNTSEGQVKVSVLTDQNLGEKTQDIEASGHIYGAPTSIYGAIIPGGGGESYNRIEFDVGDGLKGLVGRYFKYKIENVDGFNFGLEEFIAGVTSHGYQPNYVE